MKAEEYKTINKLLNGLNDIGKRIYQNTVNKGFYENSPVFGTRLMLIVSELSEALEADRKNKRADVGNYNAYINSVCDNNNTDEKFKILFERYIKDSLEDEIADSIIRILDLCAYMEIDIEKHIYLKMRYNELREYKHGKSY